MNGKLPDFKEEAIAFVAKINVTRCLADDEPIALDFARKLFAEGMRYATERIKTDEDLDFSCWIHEEADMVEKGKS